MVRLLPPSDATDPVSHFLDSLNELFLHALKNLSDSGIMGLTIKNCVNQNDNPIGISFKRKDQLAGDDIMSWYKRFHNQTLNLTP